MKVSVIRLARVLLRTVFALIILGALVPEPAQAFDLPNNFENVRIISGLDEPDYFAFAPDGRIFISERVTGKLLVAKYNANQDRWVVNSTPFHTFNVPKPEPRRSGGLRSIAFDPNFSTNGYIYAFYMRNGVLQNRVVRLKAKNSNPDIADTGFGTNGEELLIELPFNNTYASGSHNGGAMVFGTDGKLYIATGDGWEGTYAGDPVQNLRTFTGKILRINADGSIPSSNPFYNQTTGTYRAIYALGLRNPYSMAIHPTTGKIYINEARGTNKASIYVVEAGANYRHEGQGIGTARSEWANASTSAGGQLITGGAWYPQSGPFPSSYYGAYFAAMWGGNNQPKGQVNYIASNTNKTVRKFEGNIGSVGSNGWPVKPVITQIGPDGNLYYMLTTYLTNAGAIHMVRYTAQSTVQTPVINPQGGSFSSAVSVRITSGTNNADIHYTLDGSEPTASSPTYNGAFTISTDTTVKAIAYKSGQNASGVATARFTFDAGSVNQPPVVDAGSDRTVYVNQVTVLDGSGTYDPDGNDDLMYDELWTQISGPATTILDETEEIAYFTPTSPGTYVFELEAKDERGASSSDRVTFTVLDGPPPSGSCDLSAGNLVSNGEFTNTNGWFFYTNGSGNFTAANDGDCAPAARITINQGGSNVQFYQRGIPFEPNTDYVLRFRARSTTGSDVAVYLHRHSGGTNYGISGHVFDLTPNWQDFALAFTSTNAANDNSRLRFWLAPYDNSGDVYFFDNIEIVTDTGTPTPPSAPTINTHPANVTITEGGSANFAVVAVGDGLAYQWQMDSGAGFADLSNGGDVSGATSASLTLANRTTADNSAQVRVVVSNSGGNVTSNPATLTVNAAPPPSAPTINTHPANATITEGASANFAVAAAGDGLAYQWQMDSGAGFADLSDGGDVSGATSASLTLANRTTADNSAQVRVIVSNSGGNVTSNPATLTVNAAPPPSAPTISTHPANVTITEGGSANFAVAASGSGLAYQWQMDSGAGFADLSNGGDVSGATSASLTLANRTTADNSAQVRVVVSNSGGDVTSNPATLTVNAAPPAGSCDLSPSNLVNNGEFTNTNGWSFYTNGSGNFTAANDGDCAPAARVAIDKGGSNVQLFQRGIPFEPNTDYVLRFRARSTTGSDVAVYLHRHSGGTNYGISGHVFDLTADWQNFSLTFTTTNAADSESRLRFWLAPYDSPGDIYFFDNIEIVPAAD